MQDKAFKTYRRKIRSMRNNKSPSRTYRKRKLKYAKSSRRFRRKKKK